MSLVSKFIQAVLDTGDIATNYLIGNGAFPTHFLSEDEYWQNHGQRYQNNTNKKDPYSLQAYVSHSLGSLIESNSSPWLIRQYIDQRMKPILSRYMKTDDVKQVCKYAHWYLNAQTQLPKIKTPSMD